MSVVCLSVGSPSLDYRRCSRTGSAEQEKNEMPGEDRSMGPLSAKGRCHGVGNDELVIGLEALYRG